MKHGLVLLAAVVLLAGCQNASEAPPSEPAPAPPTDAEWVTLFDGTDLSHFNMLGDAQWNIIDDYVEETYARKPLALR